MKDGLLVTRMWLRGLPLGRRRGGPLLELVRTTSVSLPRLKYRGASAGARSLEEAARLPRNWSRAATSAAATHFRAGDRTRAPHNVSGLSHAILRNCFHYGCVQNGFGFSCHACSF